MKAYFLQNSLLIMMLYVEYNLSIVLHDLNNTHKKKLIMQFTKISKSSRQCFQMSGVRVYKY